ncbi:MAG TPA: RecX family transcriptional regulator [Gaiellaceae bacterium]|nr:RecX family transcriptional regulator [Gaiellaceae bacterium]
MAEREDAAETAPLDLAIRALRFRDRTAAELAARLEQRGVGEAERVQALETLERIGYVDDERFARTRAEQLAERGSGDALIRDDLERRGLAAELIDLALGALEPERERAARIADGRGRSVKTARYLASKGFGEEALEGLVAREE